MAPELVEGFVKALAAELVPLLPASPVPTRAREEPWRLIDVNEAAERLGRSTRWVRDRAKTGELPWVKLDGGALAFELRDLQAFARARRVVLEEPETLAARLRAAHEPASANGSRQRDAVGHRRV